MRKSNIELLRIVAFLMVCSIHITGSAFAFKSNLLLNIHNWYYIIILRNIVTIGVPLFVLISGFSFQKSNNFDTKKTMKKIILPIVFYLPFLVYLTSLVSGISVNIFFIVISDFLTSQGAYYHLWYLLLFVPLILIMGIFRSNLDQINKEKFQKFFILAIPLITVNSTISIFLSIKSVFSYFSNMFLYFVLLYMVGYYISKFNITVKRYILITLCFVTVFVNVVIFTLQNNLILFGNLITIFIVIYSISFFLIFKDLKINNMLLNKLINLIASYTYGAYIVHIFYIAVVQDYFPFLYYTNNKFYFLYEALFILIVASCSIATEALRKYMFVVYKKRSLLWKK